MTLCSIEGSVLKMSEKKIHTNDPIVNTLTNNQQSRHCPPGPDGKYNILNILDKKMSCLSYLLKLIL